MKKTMLAIPTPCHEDWEAMTQQAQGKFCGSCRKTVIDFSTMSDGQLADFFKKPPTSVCGRFYEDQLNRPLETPRKRIPWVKYFFQFTWPAWMLVLKSCGNREALIGKARIENVQPQNGDTLLPLPTVVGEISSAVEEVKPLPPKDSPLTLPQEPIMGLIISQIEEPPADTTGKTRPGQELLQAIKEDTIPMKEVFITAFTDHGCGRLVAGGVSAIVMKKSSDTGGIISKPLAESWKIKAYPNPVKPGAMLTINFEKLPASVKQIRLVATTGAIILSQQPPLITNGLQLTVTLPTHLTPGLYFLQAVTETNEMQTAKIMVVN